MCCALGLASRRCLQSGEWDSFINVTQCRNDGLANLLERVKRLELSPTRDIVHEVQDISEELISITNDSAMVYVPNDLNTTIEIIDTITRLPPMHVCAALKYNETLELL